MPVLLLLLGVTIGGFVLYRQWTAVPAAFREADARLRAIPEPRRLELAKQIEMRLPSQYSRRIEPGEDGSRTLDATFEELNAWLNMRFEPYLANQGIAWPRGVGAVLVAERQGQLVLAADVDIPQLRQIVSVYFEVLPIPEADATATERFAVRVAKVTAGNVPLPRAKLAELIRGQLGQGAEKEAVLGLLSALEEDRAVPIPALKVDAARRATVTDLSVTPTGFTGSLRVWREGTGD